MESRSLQRPLQALRGETASCRVVSSKVLLNVGDMAVEVMRILDEVVLERAKREQWPVIDEERIASMRMHLIVREQGERQLGSMDWLTG